MLAAINRAGSAWFGNFVLEGAHVPGQPVSERCEDHCRDCYETMEELLDVRIVGHRPAADGFGLLDIDLEGHRRDEDSNRGGTVAPAVFGYRLVAWSSANDRRWPVNVVISRACSTNGRTAGRRVCR